MDNDLTPINARPKRRPPEAVEDVSLALREHVVWPVEDRFLGLSDRGRALVAGGAVALALGIGVGAFALGGSGGDSEAVSVRVAEVSKPVASDPTPAPAKTEEDPTLHGATPVFKAPADGGSAKVDPSEPVSDNTSAAAAAATADNTGNAATDKISSTPGAAPTAARASTAPAADGPPAGPKAIAVAHRFATAFVIYETEGEKDVVRKTFAVTTTPELRRALLQRPPRQPAGVKVPKAKVLNVVAAPSRGDIYPLSVSLLRVGVTSELRLEMEQLPSKQWRVSNVLG
jgi:hypothetical protein